MATMPFRIVYSENGKQVTIPCQHRKRGVAEARPLVRRGYDVSGQIYQKEIEEWEDDQELNASISALPTSSHPTAITGSLDAYNALNLLAYTCQHLAPIAKRKKLTEDQVQELVDSIKAVGAHTGISTDASEDDQAETFGEASNFIPATETTSMPAHWQA